MKNGRRIAIALTLISCCWVLVASPANAQGVLFVKAGKVGVLEENPGFIMDVKGNFRVVNKGGGTAAQIFQTTAGSFPRRWQFQVPAGSGNFEIRDQTGGLTPFTIEKGAPAQLFRLTAAGQIKVSGSVVHPDYVFEPGYELESIEEHATAMYTNKSLPAVGPGEYDEQGRAVMDLFDSRNGMLEELEKAHVYIAQLNSALKRTQGLNSALLERLEQLEAQMSISDQ